MSTQGRPHRPWPLREVVDTVCGDLQALIQEAGAEIRIGELPQVLGDDRQLRQLLQNLLANAIKFRGVAAPVIAIQAVQEAGGVHVSVSDNGIGIAPRHFERIFDLFQRLHPVGRYPGTGIGLAVCKRITELHGGRIWLESVAGQGSTFHFTLRSGEVT